VGGNCVCELCVCVCVRERERGGRTLCVCVRGGRELCAGVGNCGGGDNVCMRGCEYMSVCERKCVSICVRDCV
jgi:hypothetical protein